MCQVLSHVITFTYYYKKTIQMYRFEDNLLNNLEAAKALAGAIQQMTSLQKLE